MVSPVFTRYSLVPDTVPSPPSRVQGRRRSRYNGQLLARDEGTVKSPKATEGQPPRETELARKQITGSNIASSKGRILEELMKDKNRWASVARSSKRMSVFVALASESLQNIFHSSRWHLRRDLKRKCPRIMQLTQRIVSKSNRHWCVREISWNSGSYSGIGCAAYPPRYLPGGIAGWVSRTSGGGPRAKAQKSLRVASQGKRKYHEIKSRATCR